MKCDKQLTQRRCKTGDSFLNFFQRYVLKCVNDVTPRFETVKRFFFRCGGGGVPITKPVLVLNKLYS